MDDNATKIRLFIVGCPRSGTTWLSYLLEQHPQVAVFEHSKLFHYLTGLQHWWKARGGGKIVDYSARANNGAGSGVDEQPLKRKPRYLTQQQLFQLCRSFAEGVLDEVGRSKPQARVIVDKTPENARYARFLLNVFPDAHFLHMVRDPRGVFASMKSAGQSWARKEFPTHPADGARFWSRHVDRARGIADLTARYRQIQYEDLANDGVNQLQQIFDWLSLDADHDLCSHAVENCQIDKMREASKMPNGFFRKGLADSWRDELTQSDIRLIEYLAFETMQSLGYEPAYPPNKRKPMRLTVYDTGDRILAYWEKKLRRTTQKWLQRWRGRELDYPEWTLY